MKKIGIFLIMLGLVFLPFSVKAAEKKYNTLDLMKTLADDEIEASFKDYKPNDDAITIYLFRGKGCGFCHAFLTFLDSITEEYGKYFKLESYEVWYDQDNADLMSEVSEYLGQPATGVPYIVIGDKVFAGYADSYDDGIKEAITTLYNTKKNKRYDVFNEMKKNPKKATSDSSSSVSSNSVIIWNLVFTLVSVVVIISFVNLKFKELNNKIDSMKQNSHEVKDMVKAPKSEKKKAKTEKK